MKADSAARHADEATRDLAGRRSRVFHIERTMPKVPPLVVREYAAPRPGSNEAEFDSPDTVLWQPVIVLPSEGQAKIPFYLGNARRVSGRDCRPHARRSHWRGPRGDSGCATRIDQAERDARSRRTDSAAETVISSR